MALDLQSRTTEHGLGWHHPETEVGPCSLGSTSESHQKWGDYRGKLSAAEEAPPAGLWQVANHPRQWLQRVKGTETRFYRAIGSAEALMLKVADLGQRWMKGASRELALKKLREQPVPW